MIHLSLVNPRSAGTGPFDPAAILKAPGGVLSYPAALRHEVWHWLPGEANGDQDMVFPQGLSRATIQAAQSVCADAGSAWCPYIGTELIPTTAIDRHKELMPYQGCKWIGFDNVPVDHSLYGEKQVLVKQALANGFSIGYEANANRPWLIDLIKHHKGRVCVLAEWWMWKGISKWLMPLQQVIDLGGIPKVLVTRSAPHADQVDLAEWAKEKVRKCHEFSAIPGVDVILRPAGLTAEQVAEVAAI